jgi:preprotein translocase subunit YajC
MNSNEGFTELVLVLGVMLLLFILGLVAVGIFFFVWRRERKGSRRD